MKKMTQLFVLFGLFIPVTSQAIVNIENMRFKSSQNQGFTANINMSVSGQNGNTQKAKAAIGSQLNWDHTDSSQILIFNYEYGESSDIKDTDKSFLHGRQIWHYSKSFSWEVFAQLESNEFTRLTLRSLLGTGARFNFLLDAENHSAYLGLGLFRSKEELDDVLGTTDAGIEYTTRANIYQVYKYKINDHARLMNMIYYQPAVDDASDYHVLEQFSLQVDITDNTSIKISLDISHDNEPPQGVETTDTSYNTGLEFRF